MQYHVHLNDKVFYHDDIEIYISQYSLQNVCLPVVTVLLQIGLVCTQGGHDIWTSLQYHVMKGNLHALHQGDI